AAPGTLQNGDIANGQRWGVVVIDDGANTLAAAEGGAERRVAQVDEEDPITLRDAVANHRHGEGGGGRAGRNDEVAAGGDVVLTGDGCAVGRRVVDGQRLGCGDAEVNGEDGVGIADVAFPDVRVANKDGWRSASGVEGRHRIDGDLSPRLRGRRGWAAVKQRD